MASVIFEHFWEILGWLFALNGEAFRFITQVSGGLLLALVVVVLAGMSQAIAQSIILFVNQVKPTRFILSLLINVVLFVAGFFFLVASTWVITLLPGTVDAPFWSMLTVLGLSYVPLLFSFLGALPYLGNPLLTVLSIWHLLAMVVGFAAITNLKLNYAFGYVAIGWIVLQILQQTIGQPIANLGRWLANQVAGVTLTTDRRELMAVVRDRLQNASASLRDELRNRITVTRQGDSIAPLPPEAVIPQSASAPLGLDKSAFTNPVSTTRQAKQGINRTTRTVAGLIAMTVLTFLVVVLLRPLREWWFGWYDTLPILFQFLFDLCWIALIALVVAGLLAPLETLGWWAGWYADELDTTVNVGELAVPVADPKKISRYIVYLDGVCQSDFKYLPDVEEFLDALAPTLPSNVALLRGLMVYSVLNNPLDEDRPLSFLWKLADRNRYTNPADLLGLLVNIRNMFIVGVSADKRYGPLYNQGIAQVVYNGLLKNGYQLRSGVPITLIGYSGGGQMSCACAPILKRALSAPVDVISLGGVISANNNFLQLEHLYHLVGDKDRVEQLGPIMFPGRWKLFPLSFWNRAKRRGKISILSMGNVAHQVPGGILDPKLILPDGRSALQQTIDYINAILRGELLHSADPPSIQASNYQRYIQADFNRPNSYPIHQTLPSERYQPIGTWMGRLILPPLEERQQVQGALFEVYHTDAAHQHLVGRVVNLRWGSSPITQKLVAAVKQDIHFSAEASYTSRQGGMVHPNRLNHWLQVDPLESLAGAHPEDDIVVMLREPVEVEDSDETALYITNQPIQISGRFYALVKFIGPIEETDQFRVVHYNRDSKSFDGPEETVRLPPVVFAQAYGSYPSTTRDLEKSPLNETGWYIYGAQDEQGVFVVRSLGPRALFRLQPGEVVFGSTAGYRYIRKKAWAKASVPKGQISSVLCAAQTDESSGALQSAIADWSEGTCALMLHVYGGIGGKKKEPAAKTPIFFGHFAFGLATVVREPLSDELRFDLRYYQVYTHNTDGLVSGVLHWSRYLGDRQFGWAGNRPVCDILIRHPAFTEPYIFDNGTRIAPLDLMLLQLQVMTSRYRTGDGTGGTYVAPANNCSQDSNQALFASLRQMEQIISSDRKSLARWNEQHPEQAQRFRQLLQLRKELKRQLQPLGGPYSAWEKNEYNLGTTLEDEPIRNWVTGLGSWRTLLPRLASDTVVKIFLKHGASVWVLRTNQIGGWDPDIEAIAPITL